MGEGKRIYTMGTSDRTLEEVIQILRSQGIIFVVDVRRFPRSKYRHFNQTYLSAALREAGIDYGHLGEELGGYRKGGYEAHTRTESYQRGLDRLEKWATSRPAVILCAERLPSRCHRRFIAQSLQERGWQVIHL
jgi:uncharacterized protein (DUF488 family)